MYWPVAIQLIMAGKKNSAPTKTARKRGASKPTTSISRTTQNQRTESYQSDAQGLKGPESEEELKRQQILLNIFSKTFRDVLGAEDFNSQLQEVKAALFNRDFEGAFAREASLDVYAARWSPTRALCYGQVLRGLDSHLRSLTDIETVCESSSHDAGINEPPQGENKREPRAPSIHGNDNESAVKDDPGNANGDASLDESAATSPPAQQDANEEREESPQALKILAIGGAAAEIVAFADYISSHNTSAISPQRAEITLLDVGPWDSVVKRLHTALTITPPLSRYASAAARAANKPLLLPKHFSSTFAQKDILSLNREELSALIVGQDDKSPVLITLLFTLNELYTTSGIKRTTAFLRLLSSLVSPGTLLLVIDSPGSYSEAAVGKEAKRYPMQWLLDHTLLSSPSNHSRQKTEDNNVAQEGGDVGEAEPRWEKIESNDSVWFRVAEGLRYPIPLENMRYQMHLYRACGN